MKELAALRIKVDAQEQEIEALKLDRAWAEATSSTYGQVGDKMLNEVIGADRVNTDSTLHDLPLPDQGGY